MKKIESWYIAAAAVLVLALFSIQCSVPDNPDDVAPACGIIYPTTGQALSGTVPITIGVSDNQGIDHVALWIDGERVKDWTEGPFNYSWDTTPVADNRNHSIQAIAVDNSGNTGFSGPTTVRIVSGSVPDTLAPVIAIINPVSGATVSGTVPVIPQVVEETKLLKVEYYVDGLLEHTSGESPYDFLWNVSGYINGSTHTIFARAFDENQNNSYSSSISVIVNSDVIVDNTPPVAAILYPTTGSTVSGTVDVMVNASDNVGVDSVDFYVDGNLRSSLSQEPWQFSWNVSSLQNGSSHQIFVTAYDSSGNQATSPVITVTVQSNNVIDVTPPSVAIMYPSSGSTITAGEMVTISVDAQDNTAVQKVEFYIDGNLVSTDNNSPYKYDWDTTGLGNSRPHTIYVKAYDSQGNTATALTTVVINP